MGGRDRRSITASCRRATTACRSIVAAPVERVTPATGGWSAMRIASPGHLVFAILMIACGLVGFIEGKFAPIWAPVAQATPARDLLIYLCAFVALAAGPGLLFPSAAAPVARRLPHLVGRWLPVFLELVVFPGPRLWSSSPRDRENVV